MTCIVGLIENERVYIGGDSAASSGEDINVVKGPKVFLKEDMLFGCTGSFRMIQLLKYKLVIPKNRHKELEKYFANEFVDAIKSLARDGLSDSEANKFGGFLLGYQGRLFEFDDNLQFFENLRDIAAIGNSMPIALGSLYSTKGKKPELRLKLALEASEYYNTIVRKPFHIKFI